MTVITITTKQHVFQVKGEITKHTNITEIKEVGNTIRLVRNRNWETILNKEINRIIAVEY